MCIYIYIYIPYINIYYEYYTSPILMVYNLYGNGGWSDEHQLWKKEGAFLGCGKATCALQKQALDTSVLRHIFSLLISSHLIWSHLMSTHRISSNLISSHLIFSYLISSHALLSSCQLFSVDLNCSHLFSCHLSFSHLFSAHLNSFLFGSSQLPTLRSSSQLSCSQLFTDLIMSGCFNSSHLSLSSSSQFFSGFLSSSRLFSAHLVSGPKPAPKPRFWSHFKRHF